MNIKNTNITLNNGAYFLEYCPSGNSYGERVTFLTYKPKEVLKECKKAGYYLFGSPILFQDGLFYLLNKTLKQKTRNHKNICVSNAMYHIQSSADKGKLKLR